MVSVTRRADVAKTSVGGTCGGRAGIRARVRASSTDPIVVNVFGFRFVAVKD